MSLRYAASYARKSTPDDVGIHDQHVQNAQAAERAGYHIPTGLQYRFADDDTSGITKSRKGLDRLRQTAESGEAPFERIYIKDRSRLGRFENPKRSAYLEVLFEDLAVPLFFVHSLAGPSSGLPEHRMVEAISATIEAVTATRSREELIQRTVGGARARMCRGRCPLSTPPYAMERRLFDEAKGKVGERIEPGESIRRPGWTYVLRLGPETEQEVVRGIFASILNNEAFRQIAKRLNTASIPAPRFGSGLRAGWTGPKIVDLVRNPIYMGDLVYGRTTLAGEPVDHQTARIDDATPIRISEMVPAIVSREIWAAAQEVLDQSATSYRARRGGQPIYALSGLMRCVDCGAPYTGFTSTRSAKIRNRYYRHDHRVRKTLLTACPARNRYIRADALESEVTSLLRQLVTDPALQRAVEEAFDRDRALAAGPELSRQLTKLTRERDAIAKTINRLVTVRLEDAAADAAVIVQEITTQHGERKKEVEAKILKLKGEQCAWEAAQLARRIPVGSEIISTALEHATDEERRRIIHAAVATIRVDTDGPDVEVVFHTHREPRGPTAPPARPESPSDSRGVS